jgi:hypothetical protein
MRKLSSAPIVSEEESKEVADGIKSVIISESVHQKLKRHCVAKKKRIGPFVEMLILNHIDKQKTDDKAEPAATADEPVA